MEGGHSSDIHRGNLLGRESEGCRNDKRTAHGRGPDAREAKAGRDAGRGPGQMVRGTSGQVAGCPLMSGGLQQAVQGWPPAWIEGQAFDPQLQRSLDGQSGRGGRRQRSDGSRRVEEASGESRKEGCRDDRGAEGSDNPWGSGVLQQLREWERPQKEEAGEGQEGKEEGSQKQEQDYRNQGVTSGLWHHRSGSYARDTKKSQKEGQASSQKEDQERIVEPDKFGGDFIWEPGLRGRSRTPFWRRGESEDGVKALSRRFDTQCPGDDTRGAGIPVGTAVGHRQVVLAAPVLPALEAESDQTNVRADEQGGTNFVLSTRSSITRQDSHHLRHDHAEAEKPRTDRAGILLRRGAETGVGPARGGGDVNSNGNFGSFQTGEGGGQGKVGFSSSMEPAPRLGEKARRREGQRQAERGQRKGQIERRERRACERRQGQGEEVEDEFGWEPMCSEAVACDTASAGEESRFRPACGSPPAPFSFMKAAGSGPTGPEQGPDFFTTKGKTLGDMATNLVSYFSMLEETCGFTRSKVQFSGGPFPLPDCPRAVEAIVGHLPEGQLSLLCGVCKALNSYHGSLWTDMSLAPVATRMALSGLASTVQESELAEEKFEGLLWDDFMAVRTVDYKGDEIRLARSFSWSNISPALPEGIGSIPLVEVCEMGTLDYVVHFENYLLPVESHVYTKPPKVFVHDDDWEQVCSGLLSKGVCRVISESEIYHIDDKPLLNGLFGVPKDEIVNGIAVHRLIMNLVPVNKLCRSLGADVSTLPAVTGMGGVVLGPEEFLIMSSEDIKCFFYIFSVPPSWHKFLAFGRQVPASLAPRGVQEPCYLCSLVLPMGFINSVSIAQHIHRRIARMSLHGLGQGIGPQNEMRRDRPGSSAQWLYRIYLDNFDSLEKMDAHLAARIRGEISAESLALREGYQFWGLPRHPKKAVQQELVAEIQGALVDGRTGKVRPKPVKVMKYVELAINLLKEGQANQKQMQVVCGGLIYCAMFRRPMLGMLNGVWSFITQFEGEPLIVKRPLTTVVRLELIRFICAVPLAQMNLRAMVRGDVTASDASEWGGGFCVSNGLTPMGAHAAHCQVRGDLPEPEDHIQVLTVGLFDGIGALRVSADALKLPMGGHISAEVSGPGSRVLESNFPDAEHVGDVANITEEMVTQWAAKYSNVGVVLVGGGPPCQGVSGLNADRKGALKDARSNLFVHVKRVYQLVKAKFPWSQVHSLMESVASMDEQDRRVMSEHMECCPYLIDAAGISLCRRPRLYWISWELQAAPGVVFKQHPKDGWGGYTEVVLSNDIAVKDFLLSGWELGSEGKLPTFTTSRPREKPGNRPAGLWQCADWERERWWEDKHRYPPYVYRDKHCLRSQDGQFRLPSIQEKEVAMGFPLDYTAACLPKGQQKGENYLDVRHSLIGNSWHVMVISWLLKELFGPLGMTSTRSLGDVVKVSPGGDPMLQGYLRRPSLQRVKASQAVAGEGLLARKLVNFVSIKGEDLLLQADSENQVKFHRLRSSVPGRLWRWKTVCGWPWKEKGYHINVLEVHAIYTCLRWRICRKRQMHCRFVHLTDSLVALHSLSRGRSSSRKMRSVLSRINALLLATGVVPIWAYIGTKQNPADRPSRRPVLKVCRKRKYT